MQPDGFAAAVNCHLYFEKRFRLVDAFDFSCERDKGTRGDPYHVTQSEGLMFGSVYFPFLVHHKTSRRSFHPSLVEYICPAQCYAIISFAIKAVDKLI